MDKVEEMDKFLEKYNFPKLDHKWLEPGMGKVSDHSGSKLPNFDSRTVSPQRKVKGLSSHGLECDLPASSHSSHPPPSGSHPEPSKDSLSPQASRPGASMFQT